MPCKHMACTIQCTLYNSQSSFPRILKIDARASNGCFCESEIRSIMTSSNGNIFRVTGFCAGNSPATGEFPSERPVTRSFDVCFDLRLNKRLITQSRRRWFETPWRSLWRHCNAMLWFWCCHAMCDIVLWRIAIYRDSTVKRQRYSWSLAWHHRIIITGECGTIVSMAQCKTAVTPLR